MSSTNEQLTYLLKFCVLNTGKTYKCKTYFTGRSYVSCETIKKRKLKNNKHKTPDIYRDNLFLKFHIYSSCFLYLITHNEFLNEICKQYMNYDMTKIINYYKEECDEFYILKCDLPINIKIHYNFPFVFYDEVLSRLDKLKKIKIDAIYNAYKSSLKYSDYAEEECLSLEKLLLSLSKINKYDVYIDNMVTSLLIEPIQCHIFCISTKISVPMLNYLQIKSINDFAVIYKKMYFEPLK
jgi:hypothetical protein